MIEVLLSEHEHLRRIAQTVGRNVSVISREVRRNRRSDGSYTARYARRCAIERRAQSKTAYRKIETDLRLARGIEEKLRGNHPLGDWSPASIATTVAVSHKTIYAWIRRSRPDLRRLLPNQGRRRARYRSVATRRYREQSLPSIDERPKEVELRQDIGHFEGDTMVLKGGRIHTLVERTTRFLIADGVRQHGPGLAYQISQSAISVLGTLPQEYRKTITYDQGSEFAWWDETEKHLPGTRVYFAHPHRPWERGSNERMNGLLRRYFPTTTNFATLPSDALAEAVWRLNHRPRKSLHWKTPCEMFGLCCASRVN